MRLDFGRGHCVGSSDLKSRSGQVWRHSRTTENCEKIKNAVSG